MNKLNEKGEFHLKLEQVKGKEYFRNLFPLGLVNMQLNIKKKMLDFQLVRVKDQIINLRLYRDQVLIKYINQVMLLNIQFIKDIDKKLIILVLDLNHIQLENSKIQKVSFFHKQREIVIIN